MQMVLVLALLVTLAHQVIKPTQQQASALPALNIRMIPLRTNTCCVQVPTCGDADGAGVSTAGYSCPPGYKTNTAAGVSTTSIENKDDTFKTSTCCVQVPSCGDADGAGLLTAAFNCGSGFQAKQGVTYSSIEGLNSEAAKLLCCAEVSA
jgi:hypothetical protein